MVIMERRSTGPMQWMLLGLTSQLSDAKQNCMDKMPKRFEQSTMTDDAAAADDGAPLSVWIGLSVVAVVSFYCQAAVTEERFVPALNVLVTEFNIPDDVAGATLMAAGASSPELFSSIVSLFVTHSALGLGTIVGSEIFNQLVICAGAVYAARSGHLKLDAAIVTREVGFYALSIALLLYALRDKEPSDDDELGVDHIFISFSDAALLAAGYVLYVIVCANFDPIVDFLTKRRTSSGSFDSKYGSMRKSKRGSFHMPEDFFAHKSFKREPSSNFEDDENRSFSSRTGSFLSGGSFLARSLHLRSSSRASAASTVSSLRLFNVQVQTEKPSDHHAMYDITANAFTETLNCFLWQRSYFYTQAKFSKHGWHLRWFTFTRDSVSSVPDRTQAEDHVMKYPHFTHIGVDDDRLIIKLPNPKEGRRDYFLLAPSREIFDAVAFKCEQIMDVWEAKEKLDIPVEIRPDDAMDIEAPTSLIEFPWGGSFLEITFHVLLLPIKGLMQFTIPDVRYLDSEGNPKGGLGKASLAIAMCLIWLIIGSYAMVTSLEDLAELMDIPDAIIGVTVSAAGTSLPNYVASKVAAQQGFGNMAVSNAFGSNTFNIMVGLGWPWALYIAFANNFQPYHGLRNDGILESVLILATVLLIFIVIVLVNNFTLYHWHGTLFIVLYVAYLAFAVAQVYI